MEIHTDILGTVVVAMDTNGKKQFVGAVKCVWPEPSVSLETDGHNRHDWPASHCRPATMAEELAYWKSRAEQAEKQRQSVVSGRVY